MTRPNALKRMKTQINEYNYPQSAAPKSFLERLIIFRPIFQSSKLSWVFHILMMMGIASSIGMDLLFALMGFDHAVLEPEGIAYVFRYFHRWTMFLFLPIFIIYIAHLGSNKKLREGLERFDWIEYFILLVFVIYGISYSWDIGIWGTYVKDFGAPENISDYTLHIVIQDSPTHTLLGYFWLIFSLAGGGLLRKALANVILQLSRLSIFSSTKARHTPPSIENDSSNNPFYANNFGLTRLANLYACGKCGNCNDVCPVYQANDETGVAPRKRLEKLRKVVFSQRGVIARIFGPRQLHQESVDEMKQGIFMECTVCGRCATVCPSDIDLPDMWLEARHSLNKTELAPSKIRTAEEAIIEENNVFAMDNEDRAMFFDFPDEEEVDIVYFMGCVTAFTGALEDVGQAVGDILDLLGVKWTILRDEEWCCGLPLELLGHQDNLHEIAKKNIQKLVEIKAKKVVFNCPGCYKTFSHLYPDLLGKPLPFETQHIVELVKESIDQGLLKPKGKFETNKLTYYDPCDLARYMGVQEEPRTLLRQLTTGFVELEENRNSTRCCGAGGGLRLVNNPMSLKLSPRVIELARDVGATTLVTACPACDQILRESAAQDKENGDLVVKDIVEILALHLDRGDST